LTIWTRWLTPYSNWRTPRTSSARLVLPRACSTESFGRIGHSRIPSLRAQMLRSRMACLRAVPHLVAQCPQCSVADDVSPGEAQRPTGTAAGRGSCKDGTNSQRPMALGNGGVDNSLATAAVTVDQPRREDWDIQKPKDRFAVGRNAPLDQHPAPQARSAKTVARSAGDASDRPR